MNNVVVDTSIAIKWALYEATNTLYRHVRSGKIPIEDAEYGLKDVILRVVALDSSEDADFNIQAMKLAHQFGLPAAYDAHYLALAEREDWELWTADARLWNTLQGRLAWVRWMADYSTP